MTLDLQPFQKEFLKHALDPQYHTVAMSISRGNGKTTLAGHLIARSLTPGDPLFHRGQEVILLAGSLKQARHAFGFARDELEPTGEYRFQDAQNAVGITHKETRTKLTCVACNGKTGQGIVRCPLIIADEPGSWEVNGGELMWEAINKARGKPGSELKVLLIGTRAPALGKWWTDLLDDGTRGGVYVYDIQGDEATWDQWATIKKANPLKAKFESSRRQLLEDRDFARTNPAERASFMSYNLNIPTVPEEDALLKAHYWKAALQREVAPRSKWYGLGIDIGSNRAWSAAVAMWESGRVEAIAMAPGIPSIREQEIRDRVSRGVYQQLVDEGRLVVAEGLNEPDPVALIERCVEMWGDPDVIRCDQHRLPRVRDAVNQVATATRLQPRKMRHISESTYDIEATRQLAIDGPMSIERESVRLLTHSVKMAKVKTGDQNNMYLVKSDHANCSRDDVAAGLVLASGYWKFNYGTNFDMADVDWIEQK